MVADRDGGEIERYLLGRFRHFSFEAVRAALAALQNRALSSNTRFDDHVKTDAN